MLRWLPLGIVAWGCSHRSSGDELQPCGPGGTCPSGYQCHADDNMCYRRGSGADAGASGVVLIVSGNGPGTPSLSPPGVACGDGCHEFPPGTTVTITPGATYSVLTWTGGGCESTGGGSCIVTLDADTDILITYCGWHWVVAPPGIGDDAHPGTCAAPFATIRKALSMAVSGDTVWLNNGAYSDASGEDFVHQGPLIVPDGVTLASRESYSVPSSVAGVVGGGLVTGSTYATVVLGAGATLDGPTVTDDTSGAPGGHGIWVDAPDVTIQFTHVFGSQGAGIVLAGNAQRASIVQTLIDGNGNGIVALPGSTARIEGTDVVGNRALGVDLEGGTIDLGGGPSGSVGGNRLWCNAVNDFSTSQTSGTIYARNAFWDHAVPTPGCARGNDLCYPGGFSIDTSGAGLAPAPCP
jgi:Protein of unknown function (DUF1565)